MKRTLGIDLGDRRTGIALSGALGLSAQPLTVLDSRSQDNLLAEIEKLVTEHDVETILVGVPYNMDGSSGPSAQKSISFCEKLENVLTCSVVQWDERLTSVAAERVLIQGKIRRKQRKKFIDKIAASLMLQAYLDSK